VAEAHRRMGRAPGPPPKCQRPPLRGAWPHTAACRSLRSTAESSPARRILLLAAHCEAQRSRPLRASGGEWVAIRQSVGGMASAKPKAGVCAGRMCGRDGVMLQRCGGDGACRESGFAEGLGGLDGGDSGQPGHVVMGRWGGGWRQKRCCVSDKRLGRRRLRREGGGGGGNTLSSFVPMSAPCSRRLTMRSSQPYKAAKWRGALPSCGGRAEGLIWQRGDCTCMVEHEAVRLARARKPSFCTPS
jgi:hypothetical protein